MTIPTTWPWHWPRSPCSSSRRSTFRPPSESGHRAMSLSTPHPGIPTSSADLEVLRAFEPIVRYTKGENFYPMAVEPYVRASSLWLYVADGADEELVAEGDLTLEGLVEPRDAT